MCNASGAKSFGYLMAHPKRISWHRRPTSSRPIFQNRASWTMLGMLFMRTPRNEWPIFFFFLGLFLCLYTAYRWSLNCEKTKWVVLACVRPKNEESSIQMRRAFKYFSAQLNNLLLRIKPNESTWLLQLRCRASIYLLKMLLIEQVASLTAGYYAVIFYWQTWVRYHVNNLFW